MIARLLWDAIKIGIGMVIVAFTIGFVIGVMGWIK